MAKSCFLLRLVSAVFIYKYARGNVVQTDGRDSDMESRIRELETQVQNLQRDIQLLKSTESTQRLNAYFGSSELPVPEVGFHVKLETTKTFKKDEIIKFDQAITRIGNAFDMNSGEFTCVQEGTYLFSLSIVSDRYNYVEAAIMKNGATIMNAVSDNHAGIVWSQGGGMTIVHLKKGDKVSVKIVWLANGLEGTVYGNGLTSFSGYLLRPK